MVPPSTALGGMRGAAGAQQQQVPPGTAYKRAAAAGASPQQALQAQARPLTQQGLGGLKPLTQAGGRQVLDKTYFVNELRQRRQQIINVTVQMREELEVLEHKKAAADRAEKLSKQLKKEVRLLQEALADNNIIIDKAGSHMPMQQIHAEYAEVRGRNEAQQARVEDILSQRLALEQRAKQVEADMASIQATLDSWLNSMLPSARQAYSQLLAEQASLLAEAARFEEDVAQLNATLAAAEGELGRNAFKQRALELQEQLKLLMERKYQLAAAEEEGRAPPEEQRDALLARIKRDNAHVEKQTSEAKQLQEEVKQLEARAASTAAKQAQGAGGIAPAQDDPSRKEKFEELKAKERELQAFLDAFPQRRAAKRDELAARQEAITATLERLTKLQALTEGTLPGQQQYKQLKDELDYKQQQLHSAAATSEALRGELAARRAELEKIDGLEDKISGELEALRGKTSLLQQEVERYAAVDAARAAKEAARADLEGRRAELVNARDTMKAELADQAWQQQVKEAQLRENPVWPAIDRLELQQRQVQQQVDTAEEFIRAHEAESNYRPLVPQLQQLVERINSITISLLSAA